MRPFAHHPDELISASLTGELTDLERRELDAHLGACAECRETLDAFREQRRLLGDMREVDVPRDLGARVRAGIEAGRFAAPWYRRPAFWLGGIATFGTVAAAALLAVVFLNRPSAPIVGQQSSSPSPSAVTTAAPSGSATASATISPTPLGLLPGDLVYTQLTGPSDGPKLTVINAHGGSLSLQDPNGGAFGAVQRAALSPDGQLLGFATDTGLKGTWRIFVTDLSKGTVLQLAETLPVTYGRRLAWSPDGRYLAFTVAPIGGGGTMAEVWLYDRTTHQAKPATGQGSAGPAAYFASWAPLGPGNNEQLWLSLAEEHPVSQLAQFPADGGLPTDLLGAESTTVGGVFAPLVSPDGTHVLYWVGTLKPDGESGWDFGRGGMPQLATYDATATAWDGTPLFSDLVPQQNGVAFASGELTWADNSDAYAFWAGRWSGTAEGNGYPDANAVYVGRLSTGALSQSSALDLGAMSSGGHDLYVVDVGLASGGETAAVTLGVPLPGDTSAPQSILRAVPTSGGSPIDVGNGGAGPVPWSGPGRFVPASAGS